LSLVASSRAKISEAIMAFLVRQQIPPQTRIPVSTALAPNNQALFSLKQKQRCSYGCESSGALTDPTLKVRTGNLLMVRDEQHKHTRTSHTCLHTRLYVKRTYYDYTPFYHTMVAFGGANHFDPRRKKTGSASLPRTSEFYRIASVYTACYEG